MVMWGVWGPVMDFRIWELGSVIIETYYSLKEKNNENTS